MRQSKEPIRLRRRMTPSGRISLYLDIYLNGKRSYEYLKLYLVPEISRQDRQKNTETLQLAETIKAKRLVELRNNEFGFKTSLKKDSSFYDYYITMCKERFRGKSTSNFGHWIPCLKHLLKYEPRLKQLKWRDIDRDFILGFKRYLETEAYAWTVDGQKRRDRRLSRNSQASYFNKLRSCCNHAYNDRIIATNPFRDIEGIKTEEGKRMYLTIDEVRMLADTKCRYPAVKRAFLFSCLTGLRRSDIMKLTWGEVYQQGGYTRIIFKQKKTGGLEYLDISPQAAELMGTRGLSSDNVFGWIHSPSVTNYALQDWCIAAGIRKKITFHCGRHTFAVMMLDLGVDIYTVSKLLGHKEISTTQIYAKVLDKNKQAAVDRIPSIIKESK